MEVNYKDLKSLFIDDPSIAIEYSQVIISTASNFKNFEEFLQYHSNNSHVSTCQNEWSGGHMSVHCSNCGIDVDSCICLDCFLNGNHQGHDYYLFVNSQGNCDCGDATYWKRSGFCSKHHGVDQNSHPENYLDEKLRKILTDIVFKACFATIRRLEGDNTIDLTTILDFLKTFLQFGDGFRRLLSISLTEKINLEKFMNHIFDCNAEFNKLLQSFFGYLTNDKLFMNNFSKINYKLMIDRFIPLNINAIRGRDVDTFINISVWEQFFIHSYQISQMKYSSENSDFDWFDFIFKALTYAKEMFTFKGLRFELSFMPNIFDYFNNFAEFVRDQQSDKIQIVFDKFVTEILAKGTSKGVIQNVNDTIIIATFNDGLPYNYFLYLYGFTCSFFFFLKSFKSNESLKFDKLFEELNKSFDINQIYMIGKNVVGNEKQNENERFVYHFIKSTNVERLKFNDNNYKSFQKGASFIISHPLFYSLAFLLRNDEICRVKIAQFLSLEKYQGLRIQLGIATLKSILSMVCYMQSLVPKTNVGINCLYNDYVNNPQISNIGIPLLFPLLQLLIGLQCNENNGINEFCFKEFFAFEMAREIGIFDDSNEEINEGNKKQMIFSFLYLSILLVIERDLFNFDDFKFVKEQIKFNLKLGVSDLNELSKLFDLTLEEKFSSTVLLNNIIQEVARQKSKKGSNEKGDQDVSFHLKEGIEVNYISAINSFNREKVLMNNEISKHPDKLIKIQQFEPEETYFFHKNNELNVRLKQFLITPTVLAIIYKTLRKSSDSHTNELNDHLAMNILILISKFVQDPHFISDSSIKPTIKPLKTIEYKSTIVDLITQLNRLVFNFSIDEDDNARIQNTMTKENFDLFLRTQISSSTEPPKSIIEILLDKGELGKNVLNQMSIEIEGNESEKSKQDLNQMKKDRARKIKESIMIHFKSLSSSFSLEGDESDELLKTQSSTENEVCSICSIETKDEILSYPLYIYRTKLPFIFDKPPLVEMTQFNAMRETDIFQDEDIIESTHFLQTKDDDDDEEIIPDPEMTLAQILANSPHLDITSDLSNEEVQQRRNMIDQLHQSIIQMHENKMQQMAERKRQRRQKKLQQLQEQKEELKRKQNQLENPNKIVSKCCTAGNLFVIQFGICQHPVHPSCVQKEDFTCPIDRSFKNGFLPNIDDLPADFKNDEKLYESLNIFINKYSTFFKSSNEKIIDVFVELVKSISGLITTFEVRLRSLPDCLDSKNNKLLSRNLFLATWHAYRMKGKPKMKTGFTDDVSEDVDSKLTVFQRFVKKLIETDDIEKEEDIIQKLSKQFVQSSFKCIDEKSEKELFLFLRRVCLAEHFLLKRRKNSENIELKSKQIIDWDDILSINSLSQKYKIDFHHVKEDFEFKPFVFSPMPKEFIRFAQDPYNFQIDDTSHFRVFNFLDYNKLISDYNDFDDSENMKDYSKSLLILDNQKPYWTLNKTFKTKNYPSVFISINREASSVYVVDGNMMSIMKPFFIDKYGCTNIGFQRSQPLFLNEERYERLMDQVLSGDFSSSLRPFNE